MTTAEGTPLERSARGSLRSAVLGGLAWKIASIVVKQGSRVVAAVIIARLLTPVEYGLAALVLVFSSLVFIFSDLALGAALIQRRSITERDRSTVFWVSIAAGTVFTAVGIALAAPIAAFYGEPDVEALVMVMSVTFLIVSLGSTQEALLVRDMSWRTLELRQMAAAICGAAAGIAIAVGGGGPWAVIGQQVVILAVATALVWAVSSWRPRAVFSRASLRDLGTFGGDVFGSRFLLYLNRNADNLLIGRVLGPAALGAYSIAYNVILLPFSQVAGPIEQLLYPAFSRLQDDRERLATAFLRVNRLVAAITVPCLLGLAVVAPDFVPVVLGEQWRPAIPVVQVLIVVGVLQSLQALNATVLQARDRSRWLLRYSIVFTAVTLVAFVAGLPFGVVGVAAGLAIASAFLEPLYAVITARALGISVWRLARNLWGVAQASALMLAAVAAARLGAEELGAGPGLRLLAALAAGAAVYPPLLLWRAPDVRADLMALARRRRGTEPADAA